MITFLVDKGYNGTHEKFQNFSRAYAGNYTFKNRAARRKEQRMLPNHLCVWRRDLIKEGFPPEKNKGEDLRWADRMYKHYTTEHRIDKVLYHYEYQTGVSETQTR